MSKKKCEICGSEKEVNKCTVWGNGAPLDPKNKIGDIYMCTKCFRDKDLMEVEQLIKERDGGYIEGFAP